MPKDSTQLKNPRCAYAKHQGQQRLLTCRFYSAGGVGSPFMLGITHGIQHTGQNTKRRTRKTINPVMLSPRKIALLSVAIGANPRFLLISAHETNRSRRGQINTPTAHSQVSEILRSKGLICKQESRFFGNFAGAGQSLVRGYPLSRHSRMPPSIEITFV